MEVFVSALNEDGGESQQSDAVSFARVNSHIFPSVSKAYLLMLTAPVTVAKGERTFSKLKTVKNVYRSRMLDERLDDLIVLTCERDIVDSLDLTSLVTSWSVLKNRRVQIA